jgi:hypothetical protein
MAALAKPDKNARRTPEDRSREYVAHARAGDFEESLEVKKPRRSLKRSGGAGTEKRPIPVERLTHLQYHVNPYSQENA